MRLRLHRLALAAWLVLAAMVGVQSGGLELLERSLDDCACSEAHADTGAPDEGPCEQAAGHADCDDACPDGDCAPGCDLCACCPASVSVVGELRPLPAPPVTAAAAPPAKARTAPARTPPGVFRPPRARA